ncbi:MAG: acyl-CoA dehydrogenase family protein [Myxococcota bacterium]|nr:acyl-CoA dehydrogenase family protein [Myxococcota bacterium]
MRFTFGEDQLLFQTTVRDFLAKECTPEHLRELWDAGRSHSPALWSKLAELGIAGLRVPESHDGMGLDEVDAVLLFEELGRAGLPEPVIATAAVAAPLLTECGDAARAERWLGPIARGEAIVAVGHAESPFVVDADVADLLLLTDADALHAVEPAGVDLVAEPANDPSRRLFTVRWQPSEATRLADGERGRALQAAAFDRGALASAAEALGATDRLIDLSVEYASQRVQFGVPIGSFQAVKHQLANLKVALEYARPVVHRAAHSVAQGHPERAVHVSLAKLAACEAATRAAGTSLQVHGAIGYTWEQDLHIWMRRAWSLERAWGRSALHRARAADWLLGPDARIGPGTTFAGERDG